MSVGTGRQQHYNSVLEITVSFLGIHKWELDIYIGLSPALHLQCAKKFLTQQFPIFFLYHVLIHKLGNENCITYCR
jgi:hypothetical protein